MSLKTFWIRGIIIMLYYILKTVLAGEGEDEHDQR